MEVKILETSAEATKKRKDYEELIQKVQTCPECSHKIKVSEPRTREEITRFLDPNVVDYYEHYVEVNAYDVYNSVCDKCGCQWEVTSEPTPRISTVYF